MKYLLAALATAALAVSPAAASAAGLSGYGGTTLADAVNVGGQIELAPTIEATSGTASANTGTGVNVTTGANINTNTNINGTTAASSSDMSGMDMQASSPVMITASDAASGGSMLTSSSQVHTDDDFTAFARGEIQSNPNIQEVDADSSSVTVKYAEPGRVLGLFPVTMTSSATISADGNVTLGHPWYYFLTSTDTDNASLRSALSTEAAASFNQTPSSASEGATSTATGETSLSASEDAQLLADINLALGAALQSSASANGSAGGSATSSSY